MDRTDWLITATPPTPNGDLHVGHLSGPYLAADVFKRARSALGDSALYVCYGDDNQSYVVTTAARMGTDPVALMDDANADIRRTLDAYRIDIDRYSRPDGEHARAVGEAIRLLIDNDLVREIETGQLVDRDTGTPLYEAFAGGRCAVCLLVTRGGICESCGHPNDPVDLLSVPSGSGPGAETVDETAKRLVLPIEEYRDEIVEFYASKRGAWRPHLVQLVDELLAKPLADFPISHPGDWGIPIGLRGWEGHVINVWAEMGLGLVHLLDRNRGESRTSRGRYVQFLGYDNSYFFAVVHPVLQFALKRAGIDSTKLPEFIFTNEFYHLDNRKFSTSQGHVLWGRQLLEHVSADEARLYLSMNSPELSEANFRLEEAVGFAESLRRSLARIDSAVVPRLTAFDAADSQCGTARTIEDRIRFFCKPEHFSSRSLARIVHELILYLSDEGLDLSVDEEMSRARGLWALLRKYGPVFLVDTMGAGQEREVA